MWFLGRKYMNKKITVMLATAVLTGSLVVTAPLIANAAVGDTTTGNTSLTLTGDASALTLDSVPSFNWGSATTTAASSALQDIAGNGNLQVTDGRGGSSGYVVTATASEMKSGEVVLPVSEMTIDTTASTPLQGNDSADVLAGSATVLEGNADSNGTRSTTASTGHIQVENSAKVGTYSGTITYTITDGGLN
jgi:hypothetical protein